MRSLQSFTNKWFGVFTRIFAESEVRPIPDLTEADATLAMFARWRAEQADKRDLDATATAAPMEPGESVVMLTSVRLEKAYLTILRELIDESLPSDEYADAKLAYTLIAGIPDTWVRVNVLSGFIINLVKAGQIERAKAALNAVEFELAFVRFETVLVIAKLTKDAHDLFVARGSADYLSQNPKIRRKSLAKSRAYLKIFGFTRDELDLFVARQTAIETMIDPEEATLALMDIYTVTGVARDLETACHYVDEVKDPNRQVALIGAFANLS